jgi:3-hydroxyisobutyrate dehydrogenase-like beta-hydroxyacid dehydrogenase
MQVGFIGLGAMGNAMANNLLKAGFALTVYNHTRAKPRLLSRRVRIWRRLRQRRRRARW